MEITTLLSIPAIIAAVEAIKYTKYVPERLIPIVAITLGVAIGFATSDWMTGLVMGLAASGAYSGVKKVAE